MSDKDLNSQNNLAVPHTHIVVHNQSRSYKRIVLASWILIILTCSLSLVPLLGFSAWLIAIPVFLATFVLAIVTLSRGGTLHGVLILVSSITIGPVVVLFAPFIVTWIGTLLVIIGVAGSENMPQVGKLEKMDAAFADVDANETVAKTQPPIPISAAPENEPSHKQLSEAPAAPSNNEPSNLETAKSNPPSSSKPRFTAIIGDTAPIVFEIKTTSPAPRDAIASYVLGFKYRDADEFTRREFMQKLNELINEKKTNALPTDAYGITEYITLGEYDFEREAFPISKDNSIEKDRDVKVLDIPEQTSGSDLTSTTKYVVLIPGDIDPLPVKLDRAKTFGPALRKSREAMVTYIGTLDRCGEIPDSNKAQSARSIRFIKLHVSEVVLKLVNDDHAVSFAIETTESKNAKPEVLASPRNIPSQTPFTTGGHTTSPNEVAAKSNPPTPLKDPIAVFFEDHFKSISEKDIDAVVSNYANQVSYFGSIVGRDFIRKDELEEFTKWTEIRQTVTKVERVPAESNLVYKVLTINIMRDGVKIVRKEVENTFVIIEEPETILIKSQSAKVLSSAEE